MSLAWMPPRYGSFMANTSPGLISSGSSSSSRLMRLHRRLAPCIRLVAALWATNRPARSSSAAAASAPSWIHALCDERTTTMLASSTATASAPRTTSAVIVSSTDVALTCAPISVTPSSSI